MEEYYVLPLRGVLRYDQRLVRKGGWFDKFKTMTDKGFMIFWFDVSKTFEGYARLKMASD